VRQDVNGDLGLGVLRLDECPLNGAPSGPFTVPVIVAPCAKVTRKIIALIDASIFGIRPTATPSRHMFWVKSFIK